MQRLNFTLDDETVDLLEKLAREYYGNNKSQTVRSALESLATHVGHEGWVISGYSPVVVQAGVRCHTCGTAEGGGAVLFRPVFQRGEGPRAIEHMPREEWLECRSCAEDLSKQCCDLKLK